VGPHGVTSSASKPAPAWAPLHGSADSWQEPAPAWAPHRVTASFKHPPAPVWDPFHRLRVDIYSTVDLHGLQGDSVPRHGLHHKLQGTTLCSGTSSPSFFTDLGVCRVLSLTSSHSSLFTAVSPQFFFFFPFLTMLSQRRYHRC